MAAGDGREAEQISSGSDNRHRRRAIALGVVVVAAAVAVLVVGRDPGQPTPSPGGATPKAAPADRPTPRQVVGSLFLQPLVECVHADGKQRVVVALSITNLGAAPIRLVSVRDTGDDSKAQLVDAKLGQAPCASKGSHRPVPLAVGESVVVRLAFDVAPVCPSTLSLRARLFFSTPSLASAESPQLADFRNVRFPSCTPPGASLNG